MNENKIIGIDEVGYGAFAGSIFVCSLILLDDIKGITDSKKLNFKQRSYYYSLINNKSIYGIGKSNVNEINEYGIRKCTNIAINRSLDELFYKLENKNNLKIIMDGNEFPGYYNYPYECIPKADFKIKEVSAASIVAKHLRDQEMINISEKYKNYSFEKNMGYGTKVHREALKEYGISDVHRIKYCKNYI